MIIELASPVHEALFDDLNHTLARMLDEIPYDQNIVRACIHMNYHLLVGRSSLTPDMVISLMDIQGTTDDDPQYVLIGECAFSEQKMHLVEKLKKYIRGLPHLVVIIMVIVEEDSSYNAPTKNSDAWTFFQGLENMLSQKDFLALQ